MPQFSPEQIREMVEKRRSELIERLLETWAKINVHGNEIERLVEITKLLKGKIKEESATISEEKPCEFEFVSLAKPTDSEVN